MGFTLRAARAQKMITQEQIARYLDITVKRYRAIEDEKISPTFEQVNKMVELFEIPVENLIFLGNSPQK